MTGFLFDEYTTDGLRTAMMRAIDLYSSEPEAWEDHMIEAMERDFGWRSSAHQYLDVYRRALAAHTRAG